MKFSMTALVFSAIGMVSALPSAGSTKNNAVAAANVNTNANPMFNTLAAVDTSEYSKAYNNVANSVMDVNYGSYLQQALRQVHQMTTEENIQKVSTVKGAMGVANKYVASTNFNANVNAALKKAATVAKGTNFNLLATQGINYAEAHAQSINWNIAASAGLKLIGSLSSITSFEGLKSKLTQMAMNYFL